MRRIVKLFGLIAALAILATLLLRVAWVFLPPDEVVVVNRSGEAVVSGRLAIGITPHELGTIAPGDNRRFKYRWSGGNADFGVHAVLASGRTVSGRAGYIDGLAVGHWRETIAIYSNRIDEERMEALPFFGDGR